MGIALLSFIITPALAFAQGEVPEKKVAPVAPGDTSSKEKPKPKLKKAEGKGQEKEKKPQLRILGSKVSYGTPRRWTKPQVSTRNKLEALQFTIPIPSASNASRMTSAIVIAEPNADKLSLADFSNGKLPRKFPASTVIADQLDGDSWRTVVSAFNEATPPYTIVDRFGVVSGVRVHFRVLLPKEDDAKATWPQTLTQESNAFINDLRIDGKNKVTSYLFYDKGTWGLREGKVASKRSVRASTSENKSAKQTDAKKDEAKKATSKKVTASPAPKKKEAPAPSSSTSEGNDL